jgi:hypothetical protein
MMNRYKHDTRVELVMGFTAILWGVWIGKPWFDTFSSSLTFSKMAQIASEWQWGVLVGGFGLLQCSVVFFWKFLSKYVAIGGVFLWLSISFLLGISNINSTSWTAYFIYAILNFLIFIERTRNGDTSV